MIYGNTEHEILKLVMLKNPSLTVGQAGKLLSNVKQ
jgi:hypothetical protein